MSPAPWTPATARLARAAGVLGVAIPTVGLVAYPIWSFPGTHAGSGAIAGFVAAHHARLDVMMTTYDLGVVLWLVFGMLVAALLREQLPASSPLPSLVAAGSACYVALLLAGFTAFSLLVYRQPTDTEARVLYDVTFGFLAMSGLPTAVALGSFAAAVWRGGTGFPRFTGYLGAVAAVAHLLLIFAFIVPDGALSLEGFSITGIPALLWIWILVTGLAIRPNTIG